MRITVAGVGYVGLSQAVLLAGRHEVRALTTTPSKAEMLCSFISPIRDIEIERFFAEARAGERTLSLTTTADKEAAYSGAELVVVAAPTDYDECERYFDTSAVEDVIECATRYCPEALIIIKSTVPVGYTLSARARYGSRIIFSPEFLRESHALYDSLHPSRIVVGAEPELEEEARMWAGLLTEAVEDERARQGARAGDTPILITGPSEAEAIKLFANTYLALRVAYFNELDTYAASRSLDTRSIIEGVCLDPRIGPGYNNPSFGYGGYCLPKDTRQLLANYDLVPQNLIEAVVRSNTTRKDFIASEILARHPDTVGIYRLTMKSGSDNFRSSAVLSVMHRLQVAGVKLIVYEPTLEAGSLYDGAMVIGDLARFKEQSSLILANRLDDELKDAADKVYTRDIYMRD